MEQRLYWRYVSPAWIIVSRAHNVQTSRCSIHTPHSVNIRLLLEHFNLVGSKLQFNSSLNTRLLSLVCFLPDGHLMMYSPLIGQPDPMKPSDWLMATDPQCSWSLGLMSALSAPEDVKLVQISSSSVSGASTWAQSQKRDRGHSQGDGAPCPCAGKCGAVSDMNMMTRAGVQCSEQRWGQILWRVDNNGNGAAAHTDKQ